MRAPLFALGIMFPAAAVVPAPADTAIEAVVVTASRTPQPLDRVGSAVTVIDRREIEERQAATAADVLRAVPGVSVSQSGPVGALTQVRIRGAEANHVLVLIDGVEANDLATSGEFGFEHLATFDIGRIEIVRGPQSALWGSDALAGVINVVTRRPSRALEVEGYGEGGSDSYLNAGARIGAGGDRGFISLSGSHLRTDGTNVARTGAESDGYDNTSANLSAAFDLVPALRLELTGRHTDATSEFDGVSWTTGLPADDADGNGSTDFYRTQAEQEYLRFGGRLDVGGGRWSHDLHYAVTATDTDTASEGFVPGTRDETSASGHKYGLYYQTSLRVTAPREDAPADALTFAADHEREEFRQRAYSPDGDQEQSLEETGVVAEYLAYIGARLSASASIRHDDYNRFEDATTWRTTAAYRLSAASRLHASLGTGQKTPTFTERFGYFPGSFVGNPDLRPEKSTAWDAGIERRFLAGAIVADITYFHADLEDEINGFVPIADPEDPQRPYTAENRTGTSHRKGVELRVVADLSERYSVDASYTYVDATQPGPDGTEIREVRRPLHSGALNLTGRWLQSRLIADLGMAYTGDRTDEFFPPYPLPAERVALGGYALVNLAASWQLARGVTVYGRAENAFDSDYEDVYGYNTPGATGVVGVRLDFAR